MRFSQLIIALENGNAELQDHYLASDPELSTGASLEEARSNDLSFLENESALKSKLSESNAGAVLLPPDAKVIKEANKNGLAWAVLKNPRLAFAESLNILNPRQKPKVGIHSSAVIGENVKIGDMVSIGANVCIGNNCEIGNGSVIHPGVVLYDKITIGDNSELHANCVIHPNSLIGSNCILHSNSVIGSDGFGFVPTPQGWYKMPQTGIVVIENDVEIGCCSTIDRPAVGKTTIGKGTKIDNLVQIGHGVKTGKSCAMASQVGIAGGAQLGDGVILAGQVGVGNRVKVGDKVIASSKCGIHADVNPNQVISGFPAMPNRLWLRCSANFKKLPEIVKAIKEINRHSSE